MKIYQVNKIFYSILIAILFISCNSGSSKKGSGNGGKMTITAAGATFPLPFYNLAFKKYGEESAVTFNYGGIGSGGGIRSLADRVIDFGATDAYLTNDELKEFSAEVVHIPTCMGAVVIAYNLPGVDSLKLTPELLEKIFLGNITNWNDRSIAAANNGIQLPDSKITVVYRSDGSGTTFIFSDYMSKISDTWKTQVGAGKALNWPVGLGAKGNPGVAGTISQSEGTIGYIGSEFAFAQKIRYASIQNSSGNFINPDIESISNAAKTDIPEDTRVMVTNSSDPSSYPISGFTWIILYKDQSYNNRSMERAQETVKFLDWLLGSEGQSIAESVNYASLPDNVSSLAKNILRSVTFDGQTVIGPDPEK